MIQDRAEAGVNGAFGDVSRVGADGMAMKSGPAHVSG
jgi:hypothetical protein